MVQEQDVEELPLPPYYSKIKKELFAFNSVFILASVLLFSYVLNELTNIHILQQSLCLSIGSIIILSISFLLNNNRLNRNTFVHHPLFITTVSCSLLIGLKIPYYSLIMALLFIISVIKLASKWKHQNQNQNQDAVWLNIFAFFLLLLCLKSESYLNFSWKTVLFLPACFLCLAFILLNFMFFMQYQDSIRKKNRIYNHNDITLFIFFLIVYPLALDLVVSTIWPYLSKQLFIKISLLVLSLNILASLILFVFIEEITLLNCFEKYTERETIFKVHHRCYRKTYQSDCCQKNQQWRNQDCLLCNQQARVVYFDCGHLALCNDCKSKFSSKNYRKCLICKQEYTNFRLLLKEENPKRQGYQRKLFIQKRLHRNQVKITI